MSEFSRNQLPNSVADFFTLCFYVYITPIEFDILCRSASQTPYIERFALVYLVRFLHNIFSVAALLP